MPIVKHIQKPHQFELIVWEVSENNEELIPKLHWTEEQKEKYASLSEKRKKEYLGIRMVMQTMGLSEVILYDEKGKPYIEDNVYISFSHSYGKVAVAASPFPIGVDIELKRDTKIRNIERKFVREDEATFLPPNNALRDTYLHIIWGLKEGLYKLNGGNLWNFLHHYKIEPFAPTDQVIFCWVMDEDGANKYAGFHEMIEDYYLVWVIDILEF